MDRRRPLLSNSGLKHLGPRYLAAGLTLLAAGCAEPSPVLEQPVNRDTLRALRWIAPQADKVQALTTEPVSCRNPLEAVSRLAVFDETGASGGSVMSFSSVDEGRIPFESPALLGGAAGRMGLSCSSCHLNGRNNPDFFIEGVSTSPGTADVTNSLFSKTRGNGAFDPVPIPDIAARDGKQLKDRRGAEFRAKVHGLIVEEFDGREPGDGILQAVIDYMDGLVPCPDPYARKPLTAQKDMMSAMQAFLIAQASEGDDSRLMARAARERLERLNERFIAANQSDVRSALLIASRAIESWTEAEGKDQGNAVMSALKTAAELVKKEAPRSLYNPDVLRDALAR